LRFGGPVSDGALTPEQWVSAVKANGYSAAYCPPMAAGVDEAAAGAFATAAREVGLVIAEVGAWSNPIGPDAAAAAKAVDHCRRMLATAELLGARCCVNIAGSRGGTWDGPHTENFSSETFDRIVQTVRAIIDAVKPTRTFYTLETMPWAPPDSADSYLALIKAVDRKAFAVHLDPVNLINSPRRYYDTGAVLRDCFRKLGPYIRSCHAKDIILRESLTVHLDECRPGAGGLDYACFLRELDGLDPDVPLMMEHLPDAREYALAADHIRRVAREEGVAIR